MYSKVQPGQPFRPSAALNNALVDLLNGPDGVSGLLKLIGQGANGVRVKNNTGATLGRFNVVTLGDLNFTDSTDIGAFQANLVLKAAKPVTADYSRDKRIGITVDSLGDGAIGSVIAQGLTLCKVEVSSTLHKYARPTNGDCTKLTSDWWGQCRIVSIQSGTGTKWAVVQVGNYFDHSHLGKFGSSVAKGATGTLTVWQGTGSGAASTAGTISSVYNRYVSSLATGKFMRVSWDNDGPEAVAMEC